MLARNETPPRKRPKQIRPAAASTPIERLEDRRLLSMSWLIDSNRTLQVTTDDNNNSIRFATFVSDPSNLDLWEQLTNIDFKIPLADFDHVNVRMGAASDFNYVSWVDELDTWAGPLTKPANIDLGGTPASHNIMFFYTSGSARLSGDGQTGGQFDHVSEPQAGTITFSDTEATQLNGSDGPDYLDASRFWGDNLTVGGGPGDDTLIGGTGNGHLSGGGVGTEFFGNEGDDLIVATGGHCGGYGGAGNDRYIGGGPGTAGAFNGEEGDDTFIHGAGRDGFDGGPGNNSAFATAPTGTGTIVLGTWAGLPDSTYFFFDDSSSNYFSTKNVRSVNMDAGAGVQDGIIPAVPGTPYPDLAVSGVDPNLNFRINHLEPTVDAGRAAATNSGVFAGNGSFRDIGDPTNTWTATVDYGDGSGPQPLSFDSATIATASGPAHPFGLNHSYRAAGTYAVTVRVTDSEGDVGTGVVNVTVVHATAPSTLSLATAPAVYGGTTSLSATLARADGAPLAGRLVTFTGSDNTLLGTALTDANGVAVLGDVSIAAIDVGTYANAFLANFAGDADDDPASAASSLTVIDENIQGMAWIDFNNDGNVDFGEQGLGGIAVTLTNSAGRVIAQTMTDGNGLYIFSHVAPDTYTICEGSSPAGYIDGKDSLGNITDLAGNQIGTALGNNSVQNTFSAIPIAADENAINYNFGEQPAPGTSVTKGQAATIGFWQNKNGQALILKFGSIANWLAQTFPQTFGDFAGASTQLVATWYQQKFVLKDKLDAQVMATALSVYATNDSLGGAVASAYGFSVSQFGLGDSTWNVGADGAAFEVSDNTTLTVLQILQNWDQQTKKNDTNIRLLARDVFGGINRTGGL